MQISFSNYFYFSYILLLTFVGWHFENWIKLFGDAGGGSGGHGGGDCDGDSCGSCSFV